MSKLIKKLAIFLTILVLIKLPFVYFYKDEPMYRREKIAEKDFNTVFVGSSRTRYSIVPAYFDYLTNKQTKSYNFGISAGLPPRTFDWCEEIMQNKSSVKYIFFELSGGINNLPYYNEPWRSFNFADYWRGVVHNPFDKVMDFHNKSIKLIFQPIMNTQGQYADYNISLESAFDDQEIRKKFPVSLEEVELSRLRNQFIETGKSDSYVINEEYWQRINKLIEIAESRKINLYFFISPRLGSDKELELVYPIYQKLNEKYKFRAAHFDKSLYTEETSIDDFHLSHKGAMIFTEKIADEFKER